MTNDKNLQHLPVMPDPHKVLVLILYTEVDIHQSTLDFYILLYHSQNLLCEHEATYVNMTDMINPSLFNKRHDL